MSVDESFDEIPQEEPIEEGPREPGWVDELLQKTPWWAISVAFHTIVLLVLWVVKIGTIPTAEAEMIRKILKKHGGHRQRTADELGISRNTLWRKMKRFGLA